MKIRVKKALLIVILLCVGGCTTQNEAVNDEKSLYFLYAAPLVDHPIWLQSKDGFFKACEELDVKCEWLGPKVIDTEKMEEVITQGMYQKADGIITQGVIRKELLDELSQQKIPAILVDSNVQEADKLIYYGKNFHTQAQLLLDEIEKTLGKDTKLIIGIQVAEMNFKIAVDQIEEIRNVFKNHPGGFEIVSTTESKSDKVKAQSEWLSVFRKHPEINVSINFAAESAEACGELVQTLNLNDKVHIYGVDDMETTIEYIKKGWIDASVVTSFYQYGYKSVYRLYDYITSGKQPAKNEQIKLLIVNKDNVNSYKDELK